MDRNNFTELPDELWARVEPLIPKRRTRTRRGRPPLPDRQVFTAIAYRLRTGCQWKALPREFGASSAIHSRFQKWTRAGLFARVFAELLKFYDKRRGIQWKWTSMDASMVKAPKG